MRRGLVAVIVTASFMATSAHAQLGGVLGKAFGLPANGEAGGSYRSNNEVRTFITSAPYEDDLMLKSLVAKAADMAEAKGFERIAVTKTKCMTAIVLGSPRSTSCYLIAVMLHQGGVAKQRGDQPVQYFEVQDA